MSARRSRGVWPRRVLFGDRATLGRSASTITREVARNKGSRHYRAVDADDRAWRRARRPKTCLLAQRPALRQFVAAKLEQDWSPEQISGWLAKHHHPVRRCA